MTIRNGRFVPKSEEQILSDILSAAEDSWGRELTNDETAVIVDFYRPLAQHFAMQQEDLKNVLDSAQLAHAEGQALDYLGDLVGVERRRARGAEGYIEFGADSKVTRSYPVPSGTTVQTEATDPIRFQTVETGNLPYLDGFEDGDLSEYTGKTNGFSTTTAQSHTGDYSLSGDAIGQIRNENENIYIGTEFWFAIRLADNASGSFMFGVGDKDNYYRVTVDQAAGEVHLIASVDGSETIIDTGNANIPIDEWLDVEVHWTIDGQHSLTVTDSSGSTVTSFIAFEFEPAHESGGFGWWNHGTASVYFDEATTRYTSIPAQATSTGDETNVGPNTLNVLANSLTGIDYAFNREGMSGGRVKEPDPDYRERIENDLAEGSNATHSAILNTLEQIPETQTVTVIVNRSSQDDSDGRPPHSFEAVVDAPSEAYTDVAEAILESAAAGDEPVGGFSGTEVVRTVELSNGQEETISFSTPTVVEIDANVDLEVTDEYIGDDRVESAIVQYIGGTLPTGDNVDGDLDVGDDVIYNKVMAAVADIQGVHDVTGLEIRRGIDSYKTDNIVIANTENADADGTDGSINIQTVDV